MAIINNLCQKHRDIYDFCLMCEIDRLEKEVDSLREGKTILRIQRHELKEKLNE